MVARGGPRQSSANAGELDPQLAGRVDVKQYYSGGLKFWNMEPVPQSGFRQMGGTWDGGPVRGRVETQTATNEATSLGPHTGTQTIWSADIAAPFTALHIAGIGTDTGAHLAQVQVNVGGTWTNVGPAFAIGSPARTRTFALAPAQAAAASAVRISVTFSISATAVLDTVTVLTESLSTIDIPRYTSLRHDSGERYYMALQHGWLDIFLDDTFIAGVWLPAVTGAYQPEVDFYAENATIGIFHRQMRSQRVRRAGTAYEWEVDEWPLDHIPTVDLGGVYAKSDDEWEIWLRWIDTPFLSLTVSIDGEDTPSIPVRDGDGDPTTVDLGDWDAFLAELQTKLRALPSLNDDVTVTFGPVLPPSSRAFNVTFGGSLAGKEYQLDTRLNTADASALPTHAEIGETEFEPLLSDDRGWPGVTGLVQDRLAYADILAEPGALALSAAAEYFDLNIEAQGATAARLDRLRAGQTAERILAIKDATYLLVFTDQSVYFAANRTITATDPLNYTSTSETGIVANTEPIDLEGKIYFIGRNDDEETQDQNQILSLEYNEIGSRFDPLPESLLASHLVRGIKRTRRQKSGSDTDASRMWMLREDGLLVAAQVIRSQEILGLCRWYAAAGGAVREILVDARNRMRLCVQRNFSLRHERMDPDLFLHAVVTRQTDMSGLVTGLELHEGREVWCVAEGYVLGPFTVADGSVQLDSYHEGGVLVGLWQRPEYESMPRWHIRPNDEIIKRPGRIHTVFAEVLDTTSIAIGANGQPARDVTLARIGDPADQPTPPANRKLTVSGLLGMKDGTTVTVTQTRPGKLRVRDYVLEEKL